MIILITTIIIYVLKSYYILYPVYNHHHLHVSLYTGGCTTISVPRNWGQQQMAVRTGLEGTAQK